VKKKDQEKQMGEAQDTLGLFSSVFTNSINIGDVYVKKRSSADTRTKGKQFQTNPPKLGKTMGATFEKFTSLAVGEPFVEMAIRLRRERNEDLKKQIADKPFRPSNPPKRSTGHGTYYGTFSQLKNLKTTDEYDKRPAEKGEVVPAPKNFLTNPPKHGTYGMIGTNIGGKSEGVNGEYRYSSELPKGRPSTAPEKRKPFVPSSPAKKGTYGFLHLNINGSSKPHGVLGEYIYQPNPVATSRTHRFDSDAPKPFRPSNPAKRGRGFYGTFRWAGQEYKEDPETEKRARLCAQRRLEPEQAGVFRPTSHPKSVRQPSIANHPRNQDGGHPAAVNARLFTAHLAAQDATGTAGAD
jgi:hypothetical protein